MRFVYVLLFATLLAVSATRLRGHQKSAKNHKQQHKYQDIVKTPNYHPKALSASLVSPLTGGKFQGNVLTVGEHQFRSAELDFGPTPETLGIHPIEKYITLTASATPNTMQINPSAALNPMPQYLSAEFDPAPGAEDIKETFHIEHGREIPNTLHLHYTNPRVVISKADIVDVKHNKKSHKNKKQKTVHKKQANKAHHHIETNLVQIQAKLEQIPPLPTEESNIVDQFPYLIDTLPNGVTEQSINQEMKEFINSNVKVDSIIPPLPKYDASYNTQEANYVVSQGHVVGQEESVPQNDEVIHQEQVIHQEPAEVEEHIEAQAQVIHQAQTIPQPQVVSFEPEHDDIPLQQHQPQQIQQDVRPVDQFTPEHYEEIKPTETSAVEHVDPEVREQDYETVMGYQREPEQQYQAPTHQEAQEVQDYDAIPQMNQQEIQQHADDFVQPQQQQVQEEYQNQEQNQQTQQNNEDPNTIALREYLKSLQEATAQQSQSMIQTETQTFPEVGIPDSFIQSESQTNIESFDDNSQQLMATPAWPTQTQDQSFEFTSLLQTSQEFDPFSVAAENVDQSQQKSGDYEQKQFEMVEDVEFEQKYLQEHDLVEKLDETLIDQMIPQNNVFVHTLHSEFTDQTEFFKSLDSESAPHYTDYDGSTTYVNPDAKKEETESVSHISSDMIIKEAQYEGDVDTVNVVDVDAQIKLPEEKPFVQDSEPQQLEQAQQVEQVQAEPLLDVQQVNVSQEQMEVMPQ